MMEQLSALDAIFINSESELSPQHMSSVSIYDPASSKESSFDLANIESMIKTNFVNDIPVLRKHLIKVPFDLDLPYLKDADNFNPEDHISHHKLENGATWEDFCKLAADIHSVHLDRSKPLWEVHIITNLDTIEEMPCDAFALYIKIHHAIADGRAMERMFSSLHSINPEYNPNTPEKKTSPLDNPVSIEKKLEYTGVNPLASISEASKIYSAVIQRNVVATSKLMTLAKTAIKSYSKFKLAERTKEVKLLEKPKVAFNQPLSSTRVVDRVKFPLSALRTIRNHKKSLTVNDAVLAIVGGAQREYLDSVDGLPEDPVVACMPIDTRGSENESGTGNDICFTNVSLCTDVEQPLDRLIAVGKESKLAKTFSSDISKKLTVDIFGAIYPVVASQGLKFALGSSIADYIPPVSNTIVTNVVGPLQPLYLAGAKLIDMFGMGPLVPQMGMMHAVVTIDDFLCISFIACPEHLKEPSRYKQCLENSFDDLLQAVLKTKATNSDEGKKVRKTRVKKSESKKGKRKVVKPVENKEVIAEVS